AFTVMTTSSPAAGTPTGLQFVVTFQFPEPFTVQVLVTPMAPSLSRAPQRAGPSRCDARSSTGRGDVRLTRCAPGHRQCGSPQGQARPSAASPNVAPCMTYPTTRLMSFQDDSDDAVPSACNCLWNSMPNAVTIGAIATAAFTMLVTVAPGR